MDAFGLEVVGLEPSFMLKMVFRSEKMSCSNNCAEIVGTA